MRFLTSILALASVALSSPFDFYDDVDYDTIYNTLDQSLSTDEYYAFNTASGLFLSCTGTTPTDIYYLDDTSAGGTLAFPKLDGDVDVDQMVKVSLNGGGNNDPSCTSVLSFSGSAPRRLVYLPFASPQAPVRISKTRRLFTLDVSSTSSVTVPANTELCGGISPGSYFATWSNVNVQASVSEFDGSASPKTQAVALNSYFDVLGYNGHFCFKNPTSTSQVVANTASQPFTTLTYSSATMGSFTDGSLFRYAFKLPTGATSTTKFYLTIPALTSLSSTSIKYQYVTNFATVPPSTGVALVNSAAAPVDNTITIDGHGVTSGTAPTHLLIDTSSSFIFYIDSSATSIHSKSITASSNFIYLTGGYAVVSPFISSNDFRNEFSLYIFSNIFAIDLTPFPTNTDLRMIIPAFKGDRFSNNGPITFTYALSSFVASGAPSASAYSAFVMELDTSMGSLTFRRNSTQTLLYIRADNSDGSFVPMIAVASPLVDRIQSPALRDSISPFIDFNDQVSFYETTILGSGLYCYDTSYSALHVLDAKTREPIAYSLVDLRTNGRLGEPTNVTIGKYLPQQSLYCADVEIDAPALLFLAKGDIYTAPLNFAYDNDYYGTYDISSADPTRDIYVYGSHFTRSIIVTVYPSKETMVIEPLLTLETYNPSDVYYRVTNNMIAVLPSSFFAGQSHIWFRLVEEIDLQNPQYLSDYLELFLTQSPIEFFKSSGSADHIELPALVCGMASSYYSNTKARFIWDFELSGAGTSKDASIDGVYVKFNNYDFDFIEYPDPATSNKYAAKDSASTIDISTYYTDNGYSYLWFTYCVQVNGTGSASLRIKSLDLEDNSANGNVEPFTLSEPMLFLPWNDDRFLTVPADEINPTSSATVAVSSLVFLILGLAL